MDFARERELVHLRYELRRLLADGRREEAPALLERLGALAIDESRAEHLVPEIAPERVPEIARWKSRFDL